MTGAILSNRKQYGPRSVISGFFDSSPWMPWPDSVEMRANPGSRRHELRANMGSYNDIINRTVVIGKMSEMMSRYNTGSQSALGSPVLHSSQPDCL